MRYLIILIIMSTNLPFGRDLNIYKPTVKKVVHPEPCDRFAKGDRVVFAPTCTCEGCLLVEKWYLKRNSVFTVKTIVEKNGWVTVELEEVPEKFFSAIMFFKNKS